MNSPFVDRLESVAAEQFDRLADHYSPDGPFLNEPGIVTSEEETEGIYETGEMEDEADEMEESSPNQLMNEENEELVEQFDVNPTVGATIYLNVSAVKGKDLLTGVFIPSFFKPSGKVDIVLYFHGLFKQGNEKNGIESYWKTYANIRDSFYSSQRNAILIAPTLGNNPQDKGIKFHDDYGMDDFIKNCFSELVSAKYLPERTAPAKIIVAGHSAGGKPLSSALSKTNILLPNIIEVWGFDCTYGYSYECWLNSNRNKMFYHYWANSCSNYKSSKCPKYQADTLKAKHPNFKNVSHAGTVSHQGIIDHAWKDEINKRDWFDKIDLATGGITKEFLNYSTDEENLEWDEREVEGYMEEEFSSSEESAEPEAEESFEDESDSETEDFNLNDEYGEANLEQQVATTSLAKTSESIVDEIAVAPFNLWDCMLLYGSFLDISSSKERAKTKKNADNLVGFGISLPVFRTRLTKYVNLVHLETEYKKAHPTVISSVFGPTFNEILTEAVHQFQLKCYTDPGDHTGVIGSSTLDSLGFIFHKNRVGKINPKKNVKTGIVDKMDSDIRKIASGPGIPDSLRDMTAANWFDYFANPSVWGYRGLSNRGFHVLFLLKLRESENFLFPMKTDAMYKAAISDLQRFNPWMKPVLPFFNIPFNVKPGYTPKFLGASLNLSEQHKDARGEPMKPDPAEKNYASKQAAYEAASRSRGLHYSGLAIDINYIRNPWVRGSVGINRLKEALKYALKDPVFRSHPLNDGMLEKSSTAQQYLAYLGKYGSAEITDFLSRLSEAYTREKNSLHKGDDYVSWGGSTRQNKLGFLTLDKDLITVLRDKCSLAWGALDFGTGEEGNGDMMHVDMRTLPIGLSYLEKIPREIESYKKYLAKVHPAYKTALGPQKEMEFAQETGKVNGQTERTLLETNAIRNSIGTDSEDEVPDIIAIAKNKIEDWTSKAVSDQHLITNTYRDTNKITAFVLHHMAFKRRDQKTRKYSEPSSYLRTVAHFCIMLDGRIIQLHPLSRFIWHAQCLSRPSVSVEFEGNFPDIKGKWWINKKSEYQNKDKPTEQQYESGQFLVKYLKSVLGITHILAHRQSSDSRENDPGPDIWYNVGQWSIDNLGLTDGGPAYKCGKGKPILPEWKTWRSRSGAIANEDFSYSEMDHEELGDMDENEEYEWVSNELE